MSSMLGKWLESAPLAATGLAAITNAKIAIGMSEMKAAFFQFFDDMLCSFAPYSNRNFGPGARHFWRAPGLVSCVGKHFVWRLEGDTGRFWNRCRQRAQERRSTGQAPAQAPVVA